MHRIFNISDGLHRTMDDMKVANDELTALRRAKLRQLLQNDLMRYICFICMQLLILLCSYNQELEAKGLTIFHDF